MSKLVPPLKETLRSHATDEKLADVWERVEDSRGHRGQHRRTPWVLASAAGLAAAAALIMLSLEPAPKHEAPSGSRLEFSERSFVLAEPGADVDVVFESKARVRLALTSGAIDVAVDPLEERQWVIDCGHARVEVVGTRFSVRRTTEAVTVAVVAGRVRVWHRGEAALLGPGESLALPAQPRTTAPALPAPAPSLPAKVPPPTARVPAAPKAPAPQTAAPARPAPRSSAVSPPSLAPDPASPSQAAPTASEPAPPTRPVADPAASRVESSFEGRLAEADAARSEGRRLAAMRIFEALLKDYRDDARVGTVAFSLGRLHWERDERAEAARRFEQALDLGVPKALREVVLARAFEAEAVVGHSARASLLAKQYLRAYPGGTHAESARRVLAQ